MPTGYTADVEDGTITDLRTFVLRCARAFGPCVMQRDEPLDVLPAKREPSSHYLEELKEAQKETKRLAKMTVEQAEKEAEKEYRAAVRSYKKTLKTQEEKTARYQAMLEKVRAWTPPTSDHEGLRTFMIEQLTMFIDSWKPTPPEKLSAKEWLKQAKMDNQWDIDYNTKQHNEELQRCEYSNRWIETLYRSLDA